MKQSLARWKHAEPIGLGRNAGTLMFETYSSDYVRKRLTTSVRRSVHNTERIDLYVGGQCRGVDCRAGI
jgi:hypothetical protein